MKKGSEKKRTLLTPINTLQWLPKVQNTLPIKISRTSYSRPTMIIQDLSGEESASGQLPPRFWSLLDSFFLKVGKYGSPQLVDRYVLEPRFSNNRSNDIDDWTEVKQMLDQGDYEMVLDDLSTNSPNDPFSSLVRGYALLKSDQADEAIRVFSELSETTSNYRQQAQFQLALALLQAGETTDAISTLDEIAGHPDHDYSAAAQNLLDDLNSCWRSLSFSD